MNDKLFNLKEGRTLSNLSIDELLNLYYQSAVGEWSAGRDSTILTCREKMTALTDEIKRRID